MKLRYTQKLTGGDSISIEMQKIEMERLTTENIKLKGEIKKMSTEKKPVLTNISNSNPKEIKKIK
jgi:cell division protein FtsB